MKMKMYFQKQGDTCTTLQNHLLEMAANGEKSRVLIEAKREVGVDTFWCKEYQTGGHRRDGCGKSCESYQPRNGKSGICKHWGFTYEPTKNEVILQMDYIEIIQQ